MAVLAACNSKTPSETFKLSPDTTLCCLFVPPSFLWVFHVCACACACVQLLHECACVSLFVLLFVCVQAGKGYMRGQSLGLRFGLGVDTPQARSGFGDVNFTSAAAIGGRGDDVLCGGLLIGWLLLQVFRVARSGVLRNGHLFGLQLGLALGDDIVCL